MNRRMLSHSLAVIGLSALLCESGSNGATRNANCFAQAKKTPAVELPKARNASDDVGVGASSFIVSMPAEGEFYVGGQRLSIGAVAAAVRDTLRDSRADEQRVYLKCGASLISGLFGKC